LEPSSLVKPKTPRNGMIVTMAKARPYEPMLQQRETDIKRSSIENGYYLAARTVLTAAKRTHRDSEAVPPPPSPDEMLYAGLFLFRHFIELSLKIAIHHSTWLTDTGQNAPREARQPADRGHNIQSMWKLIKERRKGRLNDETWASLDPDFIEACVTEMCTFDPSSMVHRYPGDLVGGDTTYRDIDVDVDKALRNLERMRELLWLLDATLFGTHEMNADAGDYLADYESENGW
jgi:hypothetical protein